MQTTQEEMRILSNRFFGNKIIDSIVYVDLKLNSKNLQKIREVICKIYPDCTKMYKELDGDLLNIFIQFIINQLNFLIENDYIFEKATCYLELSIHIFNLSWEKRWNKDRSFEEFRQVIVRHSLYRPPHSVYILSLDDLKKMSAHFIGTFYRFYRSYFFTFTPWVDIVVTTYQKHEIRKDVKDLELEKLREEADQYTEQIDPELMEQLKSGKSIHQISEKEKRERLEQQQLREKQERIDRILKKRLEELQNTFDEKIKEQDNHFLKVAEDLRNPPKKK